MSFNCDCGGQFHVVADGVLEYCSDCVRSTGEAVLMCGSCGDVRKSICCYGSDVAKAYHWLKPGEELTLTYRHQVPMQAMLHTFTEQEAALWRGLKLEQIAAGYALLPPHVKTMHSRQPEKRSFIDRLRTTISKKLGWV